MLMYWFLYDSSGTIKEAQLCDVTEWTNLNGYAGAISYDDSDTTAQDVFRYPSHYTVQNNQVVKTVTDAQLLNEAQQNQIALLRQGYTGTLTDGFTFTIGTTQYTFGWSTDDKTNLLATQEAVTDGFLSFPINYADIHGDPISIPDQTTLTSLKSKASSFFSAQHQQVLNLTGQVKNATTVTAVQAITWSEETY